jgi:hypothetical protein
MVKNLEITLSIRGSCNKCKKQLSKVIDAMGMVNKLDGFPFHHHIDEFFIGQCESLLMEDHKCTT